MKCINACSVAQWWQIANRFTHCYYFCNSDGLQKVGTGSARYEEKSRPALRDAEVSRIQNSLCCGIASVLQLGPNHVKEASFCCLSDIDYVLEDNLFGLEEFDDADVL
jgi:hypothetical protein